MEEDKKTKQRSRNFTDFEKTLLFEITSKEKYRTIIENKQTDSVHIAMKKTAWKEIAAEYNCQAQSGIRSPKQLHALYDTLKKKARGNLNGDKKSYYKTEIGTFIPKTGVLGEHIVNPLRPQLELVKNEVDSSLDYLSSPHSSDYRTPHVIINNGEETKDDSCWSTHSPTSPSPSVDVKPSVEVFPTAGTSTQYNFTERTNFKDQHEEALNARKKRLIDIEEKIKLKQLDVVNQQYEHNKKLFEIELQLKSAELDHRKKLYELELQNKALVNK